MTHWSEMHKRSQGIKVRKEDEERIRQEKILKQLKDVSNAIEKNKRGNARYVVMDSGVAKIFDDFDDEYYEVPDRDSYNGGFKIIDYFGRIK